MLGANDGLRVLAQRGNGLLPTDVAEQLERTLRWVRWLAISLGMLLVVATLSLAWLAYTVGKMGVRLHSATAPSRS